MTPPSPPYGHKNNAGRLAAHPATRQAPGARRHQQGRVSAGRWALGTLAVAVAAVLVCEATGWRFLRGPLQNALAKATGADVVIDGRFRTYLIFKPSLQAGHLHVGAKPGFDVPHLVDATGVKLAWHWGDILRWRRGETLRIDRIAAQTLDANLIRHADGSASWQFGDPQTAEPKKSTGRPRIGALHLGRGDVRLDDAITTSKLQLTVRGGEVEGRGAPSAASAASGGSAAVDTDTPGSNGYVATARGTYNKIALDLVAHVGGALPLLQDDERGQAAPNVPLRVEGKAGAAQLWFDGVGAALFSAHRFDGALRFSGPSLAEVAEPFGVTLPRTPAFALAGRIAQDAGVWQLRADKATIGSSQLNGDFRYDSTTTPPQLSGKLGGSRLLLSDLGPAVGTGGEGAPKAQKAATASGRVLPDRSFDLPSLRVMDADVQLAIAELDLGTKALAPLRELRSQVLLQNAVLQLNNIHAVVAGGEVTGASKLDGTGVPAKWAANINFKGLDLAGWVKGVQKPEAAASAAAAASAVGSGTPTGKALKNERQQARQGGAQPAHAYLTGEIMGGIDVTGVGRSTAEILGSMNGRAEATLRDGTVSHLAMELAGLDVAQALGVLVRGDRPLPLNCARLDFVIKDGTAIARQVVVDNKDSTVRVAGHIDLRTEGLELQATTRPKDTTLLSLRTPVRLTGTMSDPSVGIEGKGKLLGRAVAALALGSIAGPAAILPFVDTGDAEKGDPCAPLPAAGSAPTPAAARAGGTAASGGQAKGAEKPLAAAASSVAATLARRP